MKPAPTSPKPDCDRPAAAEGVRQQSTGNLEHKACDLQNCADQERSERVEVGHLDLVDEVCCGKGGKEQGPAGTQDEIDERRVFGANGQPGPTAGKMHGKSMESGGPAVAGGRKARRLPRRHGRVDMLGILMEVVEDEIEPELASGAIAQLHHARVAMSIRKSIRSSLTSADHVDPTR